jgi:hypothetical protein
LEDLKGDGRINWKWIIEKSDVKVQTESGSDLAGCFGVISVKSLALHVDILNPKLKWK